MNFRFFYCLLLAVALSACKPDVAPTTEGDTPAASTVAFKNNDDVLRIALRQPPNTLLPYMSTQGIARYVRELIFQTLNSQDKETYEQLPLLASVADIRKEAGGGVSYSYVLDERAKWPNGLPVTAADVIFSLKVVMNPLIAEAGPYRSSYYDIESIVTSPNNERRFRVVTRRPYILAEQAIGSLTVLPEYAYDPEKLLRKVRLGDLTNERTANRLADSSEELKAFAEQYRAVENGTEADRLIGSGPYQLTSWNGGDKLTLERREDYWAKGSKEEWLKDGVEKIEFRIIPDPQTTTTALNDELIDIALGLNISQFKQVRENDYLKERYDILASPSLSYFGLLFNQRDPLFTDQKVRRAMAHLVDVDAIIGQIFQGGLAERVIGPVLKNKEYFLDLPEIQYSLDQAEALLREAGWADTNGNGTIDKEIDGERQEFSFKFLVFPTPESEMIGTLVSEWAAEAGIKVEAVPTPPGALYGSLNKGDFAMALLGYGLYPNPDEFTQLWASASIPPAGSNRGAFSNEEADRLIKQIAVTLDDEERLPLYERFQEIIYENQPMIFLVSPATRLVISKRFDYETTILSPGIVFSAMEQHDWNKAKE